LGRGGGQPVTVYNVPPTSFDPSWAIIKEYQLQGGKKYNIEIKCKINYGFTSAKYKKVNM
jgi:hypothetical protein